MTEMIVALPMYDWPEVRSELDLLWSAVQREAVARGIDAPDHLTRPDDHKATWTDERLLVGQTCGLPYVRFLRDQVTVLGTFAATDESIEPGQYHSVIVCREDAPIVDLADARHVVVAFNSVTSQSGYAALLAAVAPLARDGRFFASSVETGGHRQSIRAVADGRADLAAIDCVSWETALDHDSAARKLRVVTTTAPVPGLPLITANRHADQRDTLRAAISAAFDGLDDAITDALHVDGFVHREGSDYDELLDRLEAAAALGYSELT